METNQRLRRILIAAAMTSIVSGVLQGANPQLPSTELPTERFVHVCLENVFDTSSNGGESKTITSHIFAAIGVKLIWVDCHGKRAASRDGTIIVNFSAATPIDLKPGALGLSFPFEGTHARVFCDRIRRSAALSIVGGVRPSMVSILLGHVVAHEITHLLEGTNVHSNSGIMKASWDASDYDQMARRTLTFTDRDVRLIYAGLDARSRE